MPPCSRCPSSDTIPICRFPATRNRVTPAPIWWLGESVTLAPGGGRALVPTGASVAIPEGYAGFVQPRSGLAFRHGVTVLNTPGLIDAGYRGELKVLLVNTDPVGAVRGDAGRADRPAGDPAGRACAVHRGRGAARHRTGRRRLRQHRCAVAGARRRDALAGQSVGRSLHEGDLTGREVDVVLVDEITDEALEALPGVAGERPRLTVRLVDCSVEADLVVGHVEDQAHPSPAARVVQQGDDGLVDRELEIVDGPESQASPQARARRRTAGPVARTRGAPAA